MGVLATDNFTRANESPLSQGGNWSNPGSLFFQLTGNVALPVDASNDDHSWYTGVAFPDDQYASVTLNSPGAWPAEAGIGVMLRFADANNLYRIVTDTTEVAVAKQQSGAYSLITTRATTFATGDVLRAEIQGTTLRVFKNGVQLGADIADGATTLAAGSPGLFNSGPTGGSPVGFTGFEAGDFAVPPTDVVVAWIRA